MTIAAITVAAAALSLLLAILLGSAIDRMGS